MNLVKNVYMVAYSVLIDDPFMAIYQTSDLQDQLCFSTTLISICDRAFKLHKWIYSVVIDVGIAGVRCMYHPPLVSKCLKLKFCLIDEEVLLHLEVDTYAA